MSNKDTLQERMVWIDAARGIGIILVVIAHVERGLIETRLMSADPVYVIADSAIYSFHMPLFFFLSGLHLLRGFTAGRSLFFRDKLKTIVWPYFLWSFLHIITVMVVGQNINEPLGMRNLAKIPWHPVAQFWFLYALFLCFLVIALLHPRRILLIVVALVGIVLSATFGMGTVLLQAMHALPFVVAGALIGPRLLARAPSVRPFAPALMISGWLLLAVALGAGDRGPAHSHFQPVATYLAACAGILGALMLAMIIGGRAQWLCRIGQASMAIYVAHTFFAAGIRIFTQRIGIVVDPVLLLIIASVVGIGGPWLLYRWAGERGLTTLLGLGKYVRA